VPVQLTLRSPKGGRVLAERTYDEGRRIDASSGWLVVVDRNGSVIAVHAACPGLEGRLVEYASAAAPPRRPDVQAFVDLPEPGAIRGGIRYGQPPAEPHGDDEDGDTGPEPVEVEFRKAGPDGVTRPHEPAPPLRVADLRGDDDRFAEQLLADLRRLGDEYGPLGVAITAATLTDPRALVAHIDPDRPEPDEPAVAEPAAEPDKDDPVDHTHDGCEANLDALRAEVARLTGLLDQQRQATVTLRGHLDAERARAEQAEEHADALDRARSEANCRADELAATVELYRHRYGSRLQWSGEQLDAPADEQPTSIEIPPSSLYRPSAEHPIALRVYGPGLVTFDGHALRIEYDTNGRSRPAPVVDLVPHEPIDLRPVEEDPRRPHLDAWPDDAVLLRYVELRRLVALHLERYCDARSARAMLEGDVPLRLSEVLG
jgi:hypothetical protein